LNDLNDFFDDALYVAKIFSALILDLADFVNWLPYCKINFFRWFVELWRTRRFNETRRRHI